MQQRVAHGYYSKGGVLIFRSELLIVRLLFDGGDYRYSKKYKTFKLRYEVFFFFFFFFSQFEIGIQWNLAITVEV